jgi:hypothetical protein
LFGQLHPGLRDPEQPQIWKESNMRTKLVVLSLMLPACSVLVPDTVYAEEYRGTLEQQMACTPDVWRLCSDQIPDVNRIVACLQRNTPSLSGSCRAVFESSNSMPPQSQVVPPPRARAAPAPNGRITPPPPRPGNDDDDDDN